MKFTVRIFTVIPGETARSYPFVVEADSMDTAQIQLSRKIAHDWVEIPSDKMIVNVRTSYIAATEIEMEEEPLVVVAAQPEPQPVSAIEPEAAPPDDVTRELSEPLLPVGPLEPPPLPTTAYTTVSALSADA